MTKTLYPGDPIEIETKGIPPGTISFFGIDAADNVTKVIISCDHVMLSLNARVSSPSAGSCPSCCIKNVVGTVWDGFNGEVPIGGSTFKVDAAKARRTGNVFSLNWISGLSDFGNAGSTLGGRIVGTRPAVFGERVAVFGSKNGRILGNVVNPAANNNMGLNLSAYQDSLIVWTDAQYAQDVIFGSEDSGAPIVTESHELVGMMYSRFTVGAVSINQETRLIGGCHINAVLNKLNVVFDAATTASAGELLHADSPMAEALGGAQPWPDRIREIIPENHKSRPLVEDALRHSAEIANLVHHCRPVKVAWHRVKGPAWTAHLLNSWRNPDYVIPDTIEGVTRAQLLTRMREVLSRHGSLVLAASLEENANVIFGLAGLARVREILQCLDVPAVSLAALEVELTHELV